MFLVFPVSEPFVGGCWEWEAGRTTHLFSNLCFQEGPPSPILGLPVLSLSVPCPVLRGPHLVTVRTGVLPLAAPPPPAPPLFPPNSSFPSPDKEGAAGAEGWGIRVPHLALPLTSCVTLGLG